MRRSEKRPSKATAESITAIVTSHADKLMEAAEKPAGPLPGDYRVRVHGNEFDHYRVVLERLERERIPAMFGSSERDVDRWVERITMDCPYRRSIEDYIRCVIEDEEKRLRTVVSFKRDVQVRKPVDGDDTVDGDAV